MVTTSFDDHPLITYIVFIDAISAAMLFNMPINFPISTCDTSNVIWFLSLFKTFSLWYCVKISMLISAYIVWFSSWSKKKKSESWSTTSWPPTGSKCKLCQWKTIYIYSNIFIDTRPQHPRGDHIFPDQILGMDTVPETSHLRCNGRIH